VVSSLCSFSKSIESTNILNSFWYLDISVFFVTGHYSVFCICFMSMDLSSFTKSHSYIMWSTDWSLLLQGHIELSMMWNRWRLSLVSPWPVRTAVKLDDTLRLVFSLSLTCGKNDLVTFPLLVSCHSVSQFAILSSLNSLKIKLLD